MTDEERSESLFQMVIVALSTREIDVPVFDDDIARERAVAKDPANAEMFGAWLQSRPESIKALARRFPPFCRVRANQPLACPRQGTVGVVRSWFEAGSVGVEQERGEDYAMIVPVGLRGACDPEWLEVVGYEDPWTPEYTMKVLDGGEK